MVTGGTGLQAQGIGRKLPCEVRWKRLGGKLG